MNYGRDGARPSIRDIREIRGYTSSVMSTISLKTSIPGPKSQALDRKSTRLNSSHSSVSRMPSSA